MTDKIFTQGLIDYLVFCAQFLIVLGASLSSLLIPLLVCAFLLWLVDR